VDVHARITLYAEAAIPDQNTVEGVSYSAFGVASIICAEE
jgi:hypothetical protein